MSTEEEFRFFNLQVELNDICNLECRHCYQIRIKDKEELDINLILDQIKDLKEISGYQNFFFRLSGGEVTLRKDLFKIIRQIISNGHYVEVITNGVFLDLPYVYALKASKAHICQVSIDGSKPEIHDYIRGKGSFDKTIKGIKNLVKVGIPTEIKFTLIKGVNTNDIRDMFQLCTDLGVKYLSIGRFILAGNGIKNFSENNLTTFEMRDTFYKIIEIGREFPNLVIRIRDQLARILPTQYKNIPNNVHVDQKPYMGINYLAFDTYGNVYADRQLDIIIGNIHKKSLKDIWLKSKKLKNLKSVNSTLKGKCINCHINELCMGGNKTASYALTKDPFTPDPGCWLYENELVVQDTNKSI